MEASTSLFVLIFSCSHSIDTSRNWQFFPVNNDIDYRQPETRAIMNWVKQEHFTASASLHGVTILTYCSYNITYLVEMRSYSFLLFDFVLQGALVANYPWDGTRDTRWFLLLLNYLHSFFQVSQLIVLLSKTSHEVLPKNYLPMVLMVIWSLDCK